MKKLLLIVSLSLPLQTIHAAESAAGTAAQTAPVDEGNFSGKVLETMSTAGYTYVLVDTGSKKLWAAATACAVNVGDTVTVQQGMPMSNYHSKSLDRDFEVVYFTGSLTLNGAGDKADGGAAALPPGHPAIDGSASASGGDAAALPPGHPALPEKASKPNLDLNGIQKADGGMAVSEIYAASSTLAGQPVVVRGKVVKYNADILGKNWAHIRDGSGSPENKDNDLMVTTTNSTKVGDVVLIRGNVATNRDFGAGYKYSLMVENATVTVE